MRRTRPAPLVGLGLAGIVIGFLLETGAVATGSPVIVPPVSLAVTLLAIGVIVVLFAIPIRRAVRGSASTRIDPFAAARIAVLAKACSLAGSLLTGMSIGVLAYLVTRSVLPAGSVLLVVGFSAFSAAVLMVAGLVAEAFCALPPPGDDDNAEHAVH